MATYEIELSDGRVFHIEVEGNTPPTEEDLMAYIENNPQLEKNPQVESNFQVEDTSEDNNPVSAYDSNVLLSTLAHMDKARKYWQLKALSGGTFGASDFLLKQIPGADLDKFYNEAESTHPYIKPLGSATEFLASFPTGGGLLKGSLKGVQALEKLAAVKDAPKYLKTLAKIARAGYLPATGAAEGAAIGGFGTESLKGAASGALFGGTTAGTLGLVGAGLRKLFSAADVAPKMKQGMGAAVKDPETTKVLNTAVGSNEVVAEGVLGKVDDTKRALNKEAMDEIDKVFGKGNYEEGVNQARANFKSHMNETSSQQIFDMDNDVKYIASTSLKKAKKQSVTQKNPQAQKKAKTEYLADALGFERGQLSHTQEQWLKRRWDSAREAATSRGAGRQGDYGHVQRVLQDLNADIRASRKPQPLSTAKEAQVSTAELIDLRNKLMNLPKMKKNPYNEQYARAMRLEDAYESGLQHTPKRIKKYDIQTPEEQLAFDRGVMDRIINNPETSNVAKNAKAQADVFVNSKTQGANDLLSRLRDISNYYDNAESLGAKAYNKVWGDAVRKNYSVPTSSTKMMLDAVQDVLTGRKYRKLGKYIIDPTKKIEPLNIIPYYNFGQQSTNAFIRAIDKQESK